MTDLVLARKLGEAMDLAMQLREDGVGYKSNQVIDVLYECFAHSAPDLGDVESVKAMSLAEIMARLDRLEAEPPSPPGRR